MKRCPECRRDYYDDTLLYCLDDGKALLDGPASLNEPSTAIWSDPPPISGSSMGQATDRSEAKTAILGSPATAGESDVNAPDRRSFDKRLLAIPLVILLVTVGGYFGYRYFTPALTEQVNSVAVLPFENKSGNADTDYLSDGLADSLIYRLSQLPGLKVSPTSSVMRYKGSDGDVARIAKELDVDAVMSGRLVQRGDDLSISVQLIDSRTGKLIWAEQYDRKLADLLATQREIATTITQKLQLKLAAAETKGITKKYTNSNEAYQSYLKGRFYWNKRTAENVERAIELFQQAADSDPAFALAYVGLADCYLILEQYGSTPSSETLPRARAAAVRALEIDESLAEAHTSLGKVNDQQWQPDEAEKEYKRAIELNPNYATAHHWYSILLSIRGQQDEAFAEIQRAEQADPLSPIILINLGIQYILRGDLDAAAAQYQKAAELNPGFPRAIADLGYIYAKQGREQEAIAYLQKAADLSGRANEELGFLGYGYGVLGKRAEAMAVLNELEARHARRKSPAVYPAAVYGALGDKDQAFAWIEKDFQARTGLLPLISVLPIFDTLRDDPRYSDLMRRMGFR